MGAYQIDEVVKLQVIPRDVGNVAPLVDSGKIVHLAVAPAHCGRHEIPQTFGGHLDVAENLQEYEGGHHEAVGVHHEHDEDAVGGHHEYVVRSPRGCAVGGHCEGVVDDVGGHCEFVGGPREHLVDDVEGPRGLVEDHHGLVVACAEAHLADVEGGHHEGGAEGGHHEIAVGAHRGVAAEVNVGGHHVMLVENVGGHHEYVVDLVGAQVVVGGHVVHSVGGPTVVGGHVAVSVGVPAVVGGHVGAQIAVGGLVADLAGAQVVVGGHAVDSGGVHVVVGGHVVDSEEVQVDVGGHAAGAQIVVGGHAVDSAGAQVVAGGHVVDSAPAHHEIANVGGHHGYVADAVEGGLHEVVREHLEFVASVVVGGPRGFVVGDAGALHHEVHHPPEVAVDHQENVEGGPREEIGGAAVEDVVDWEGNLVASVVLMVGEPEIAVNEDHARYCQAPFVWSLAEEEFSPGGYSLAVPY